MTTEKQLPDNRRSTLKRVAKLVSEKRGLVLSRSPIFIILAFALIVHLYKLGHIGANSRELANIDRILSFSDISTFLKGDTSTSLYYFLQYIWGGMTGYSVISMRVFSVVVSMIGLYGFYKFTENWFSKRMAQIATFLFSISSFHILMSRSISHEILYPAIILWALYFLTLAYRQKDRLYFLLAGILLGLSIYASELTFVLGIVFIFAGAYFFYKNKKFLTAFILEKVSVVVTISLLAIPFLISLGINGKAFFSKFIPSPFVFINNLYEILASLTLQSPFDLMYNIGSKRIFDPLVIVTFLAGFAFILYGIRRRKFYFLFVWFISLFIITALLKDFSLANFIYISPVIFILSALIQDYILSKWFQTFPFNRLAGLTMILGIGFFYALSLSYNLEKVFFAWMKYPDRQYLYNIEPLSIDLDARKTYLYNAGISKQVASVVLKIDNRNNISTTNELSSVAKGEEIGVITTPKDATAVRDSLKNMKEYTGQNIVLFEGEVK